MDDVIPFLAYLFILSSRTLRESHRKIHFTHGKENNILNIVLVFRFQQHLPSKHNRLRDSKLAEWIGGLRLVTRKKQEDQRS